MMCLWGCVCLHRHAVHGLTLSSGYFDPASSKSPFVMCRSVQTVFRKSYVSCNTEGSQFGYLCLSIHQTLTLCLTTFVHRLPGQRV